MKPYDPKLLRIFATEQSEHIARIRALADAIGTASPEGREAAFDELLRRAHTLKGAARAVGIAATEKLSHAIEAAAARARSGEAPLEHTMAAIGRALDAAEDVLATASEDGVERDVSGVVRNLEGLGGAVPEIPGPAPRAKEPHASTAAGRLPEATAAHEFEFVRVSAESADEVVRASSQLLSVAASLAADVRRSHGVLEQAQELQTAWRQFRRASAPYLQQRRDDPAFAPIFESLSRVEHNLREVTSGLQTTEAARQTNAWNFEAQARQSHAAASRIRMVTAEAVFGGFGAMVRDLARGQGKEAEFRAQGLDTLADRLVLQALKDPVMHLLRNAVDHGIETPAERAARGKPETGRITLEVRSRGDRLHISIEDDGRGLDIFRIGREAAARGILTSEAAASLTPAEAAGLIFKPGFSTAASATELSGRGVGLSVVRETARQLGGEVAVQPREPAGTRIDILAPVSISTERVLLVEAGAQRVGLPAAAIERLWRGAADEAKSIEGREAISLHGALVPLARLSALLGSSEAARSAPEDGVGGKLHVAVVASGGQRAGFVVDRFVDDREAIINPLGLPPALSGIARGGVPLEDGGVAVILDPHALLDRFRSAGALPAVKPVAAPPRRKSRILVVDDSLTTRALEKNILESHGYDVRVSVDGVQALEELRGDPADLVITDVMMPRMDGLELLRHMKADPQLSRVPVVIVTSLERREDQERGLSLGADAYIVKRKFDQRELLDTVRQIL